MKKLLLLILAFSFQFATAQNYEWVNVTTAGSDMEDTPGKMRVDHNDDLIQTGSFMGATFQIGSYTLQNHSPYTGEASEVYIAKYNNDGSVAWAHGLSTGESYFSGNVKIAANNNYLFYSNFTSDTLFFDNDTLYESMEYGPKSILLNLNEDGTRNWFKIYEPYNTLAVNKSGKQGGQISLNQVTPTPDGGVVATGFFMGQELDIGDDLLIGNDFDLNQSFFARYNSAGDLLWSFTDSVYLTQSMYIGSQGMHVVSDNAGNTYVGANLQGDAQDSTVISLFGQDTLYSNGYEDIIFSKFDDQGNPVWTKLYGNNDSETVKDIAVDANNDIYMLAYYASSTIEIEGQTFTKPYIDSTSADAGLLLKYNQDGNLLWSRELGLASPSNMPSLDLDDKNNVIVKTQFLSNSINIGDTTLMAHNNSVWDADLVVAKFSPDGTFNWAYNIGGYQSVGVAEHDFVNNQMTLAAPIDDYMVFGQQDTINQGGGVGFYYAVINSDGSLKAADFDTSGTAQYQNEFSVKDIEVTGNDEIFVTGSHMYEEVIDGFIFNNLGGLDVFTGKIVNNFSISGTVATMAEEPLQNGMVHLYKASLSGPYSEVDSMELNTGANYSFEYLDTGRYIVMAEPDAAQYPNLVSTYYGDAFLWKNATQINLTTESYNYAYIYVQEKPTVNTGNATIEGKVETVETKISKSTTSVTGQPVKGVSVILVGKEENKQFVFKAPGDVMASTETDADGIYQFNEIAVGKYDIVLDIPGIEQDSVYEVSVEEDEDTYENYNYVVQEDTIFINEDSNPTNINHNDQIAVTIYPNPATSNVFVKVGSAEIRSVELYDVAGKKVYSEEVHPGSVLRINISNLSKGLYMLKIKGMNQKATTRKLLIQ